MSKKVKIDERAVRAYDHWQNNRYTNRSDKGNIYGMGITDQEFRENIIDIVLGLDWYVVDPLCQTQVNEMALEEIIERLGGASIQERNKKKTSWR